MFIFFFLIYIPSYISISSDIVSFLFVGILRSCTYPDILGYSSYVPILSSTNLKGSKKLNVDGQSSYVVNRDDNESRLN